MNPFTNEPYDWGADWQAIGVFIVLAAIGFATGVYAKYAYPYGIFMLTALFAYRSMARRMREN